MIGALFDRDILKLFVILCEAPQIRTDLEIIVELPPQVFPRMLVESHGHLELFTRKGVA